MKIRDLALCFGACIALACSCSKDKEIDSLNIRKVTDQSSPYLLSLLEYQPAPGQFINTPLGDPLAAKAVLGKPGSDMVSLGGFGGYISASFDHTITNKWGNDIVVYGNAYDGSSEPGIVMVSFDDNGNGLADDSWYELAGGEYQSPKTIHNYKITYTNPHGHKDVSWEDNQGNSGVIKTNEFHKQEYYPSFILGQESVTFTGTLLENKTDMHYQHPLHGEIVYNAAHEWGYVDNYSFEYKELRGNQFDISWAVDSNGEKVDLPGVDFIKVYTATNADGGAIGENSTEVCGAADMHML